MAYNLSNLLQDLYSELGQLIVSAATGGANTSVVDSDQAGAHGDDDWKHGALFVISADDAAPQAEFERISAYDDSSGTFTLQNALTAAVASGDTFGFASDYYPLRTLVELCNASLRSLGDIALVDTTTLDTATNTTEYAAALAWKRRRPLMIDYQGNTGADGDKHWIRVYDWEMAPASPGATGLIIFNEELPSGRDLRIWYLDSHPRLSQYNDVVSETIAPELALAAAVERALRWQHSRQGGGDPFLATRWNDAKIELARARINFPIWTPRRISKLMKVRGM